MELHAHCDPTSPPLSKSLLYTALGDVIQSLDLSLCDISVVVRYLKSCISLMNDLDEDQVHHSSSLDASSSISLLPSPQTCCISDWYQLLLSLMEQDTQTTHSDIALYNIFYSTYLFKAKYFYASKKFLLKSLEIYQHIYTYDHRAVSTILSKLSLVSQELGNVQEAMKFLQESLEIKSSLFGSKHPLVGWDMNRLACMLSSQKEYSNAMFYHIAAIQSFQISFGDSQLDTIHAYGNLGLTLIAQGDTKRGMHILQDILFRFFQAGIPLGHPWIQRYTSYLKILNFHNTHGHRSDPRAQAQDSQETRQENHLELLSLERVSSPEITPSLFASIDTPAHHDSQTSFSNSSHHSPVPVQGAVDESFHVFLTLFSQQLKEGEGLQNTKQSYSHEQQKSSSHPHILTDENRFPDAALVLTE
jgi:tetratricopeptide (TPR) repeat protein